jgi:hypothetical protein
VISADHPRVTLDDAGCWVVAAGGTPDGYKYLTCNGVTDYAHRLSYEQHVGPIPSGHEVDHLCRNRACCNPEHLEAISAGENRRRAHAVRYGHDAAADVCVNGHEWSETERWTTGRNGKPVRYCSTCVVDGARVRRQARRLGLQITDRRRQWVPLAQLGGAA